MFRSWNRAALLGLVQRLIKLTTAWLRCLQSTDSSLRSSTCLSTRAGRLFGTTTKTTLVRFGVLIEQKKSWARTSTIFALNTAKTGRPGCLCLTATATCHVLGPSQTAMRLSITCRHVPLRSTWRSTCRAVRGTCPTRTSTIRRPA